MVSDPHANMLIFQVRSVAIVQSALRDLSAAPRQGDEGGVQAWLVFEPSVRAAWENLAPGDDIVLVTWLDRADRTVLTVHPRDNTDMPERGVFSTRSQHRPNPLGLHEVRVIDRSAEGILVEPLEAVDGTSVLDIKPILGRIGHR